MIKGEKIGANPKKGFVARKAITSFESGFKRSLNTVSHSQSSYSVKAFKML